MALCLLLWGTAGRVGGQCAGASSTPSSWVGRMTEMLFLYQLQDFGQVIQQRSWGSQSPRRRQCVPRGMSSQELVTTAHSFPSPWSRPFWWMSWLRQGTTWPQPRNNLWSDWGPGRELMRIEFSPLHCVHGYVGLYPLSDICLNGESMPLECSRGWAWEGAERRGIGISLQSLLLFKLFLRFKKFYAIIRPFYFNIKLF